MSDTISFDGVGYIGTAEAAERAALSSDYISLLSRQGKIRAKHVGRQWYVDPQSLHSFLAAQNALKEKRAAELSTQWRAVAERAAQQSKARSSGERPDHPSSHTNALTRAAAATFALALLFALALPQERASALAALENLSALAAGNSGAWHTFDRDLSSTLDTFASAIARADPFVQSAAVVVATDDNSLAPQAATSSDISNPSQNSTATSADNSSQPSPAPTIVKNYFTQPVERITQPEPLVTANFVTEGELTSQLLQLSNSLTAKFTPTTTPALPEYVAADGNGENPYAAENSIGNLSNVTITNANLTASEIPTDIVAANYLPLQGGTLTGTLNVPTLSASSTNYGTLTSTDASTTNFSVFGNAYFGGTATSTFDSAGDLTLAGSLVAPGNVTLGNATATAFFATNASTTNATSTNLFASVADFTTGIINSLSGTQLAYIAGSTTNFSNTGTAYFGGTATSSFNSAGQFTLANLASAVLSVNASGQVVATTSISTNLLTGTLGIGQGGTNATSYASGELLAYNGTQFVSTSTIGNSQLQHYSLTVSAGAGLSGGGAVSLGGSTSLSLNLGSANSWTGLQSLGSASTTLGTISTLWLPNIAANSILYGNGSNKVAAASVAYPLQFSSGSLSLAFGTTTTNNWSHLQTLQGGFLSQASSTITAPLTLTGTLSAQGATLTGTSGTTTIAAGQGFTIGSSQFVVQQGSGDVGIGTESPRAPLDVNVGGDNDVSIGSDGAYDNGVLSFNDDLADGNILGLVGGGALGDNLLLSEPSGGWTSSINGMSIGDSYFETAPPSNGLIVQGNVGIGTTSPSQALSVNGNIFDAGSLSVTGTLAAQGATLTGTSGTTTIASGQGFTIGGNQFVVQQGSGNVGIGTTNPSGKFGWYASSVYNGYLGGSSSGIQNQIEGQALSGGTLLDIYDQNGSSNSTYPLTISNNTGAGEAKTTLFDVTDAGNVGIGTTTPQTRLSVWSPNTSSYDQVAGFYDPSSTGIPYVGIGVHDPTQGGSTGGLVLGYDTALNTGWVGVGGLSVGQAININASGNVGIGYTNPDTTLAVNGNVAIGASSQSGAGLLSVDYNANSYWGMAINDTTAISGSAFAIFQSNGTSIGEIGNNGNTGTSYNTTSDRRLKENIATTTEGLATLMQIPVDNFDFINDPTHTEQQGFIAQTLYPIYPEAVTTNGDNGIVPLGPTSTPWEVDYGRITPLIVSAVQDIANISSTFEQNLIAWLGNTQNGIGDLYATAIHAATGDFSTGNFSNELCVGSTCVTPAQFQEMVAAANISQSSEQGSNGATSDRSQATNTPPVIQINGDNPAIVQVGATYNDLGATITGPQADLNLRITTYLNGTLTSNIVIGTSEPATDTIEYVATDQNGLTSTTTRTVIVEAPSIVPSDDASTTDDASSTVATTTDATTPTATSTTQ